MPWTPVDAYCGAGGRAARGEAAAHDSAHPLNPPIRGSATGLSIMYCERCYVVVISTNNCGHGQKNLRLQGLGAPRQGAVLSWAWPHHHHRLQPAAQQRVRTS
eukprot:scaffold1116_cov103-Isochrysis_galbana.AAC.2